MEQLINEINELERQIATLDAQIGQAMDEPQRRVIIDQQNLVRNRLSEKREELRQLQEKEQSRAEEIEQKVHDEAIPFAVAGIDFTGLPAEVITLIEAVVKADRRRMLNEHAIELEQLETEARENGRVIEELRSKLEECEQVGIERAQEIDRLKLELADALAKRDAAVREKEEIQFALQKADAQIESLRAEIESYQRAQEYSNRQSEQVSANEEEKASISAAVEAVKKLYKAVEDWGSIQKVIKPDGTFELATRQQVAEEWAPIEPPEVHPFRGEDIQTDIVAPEVAAPVEDTFPNTTSELGNNEVSTGSDVGTVQEETVTRAEFEELKRRVNELENFVVIQANQAA